MKRLQNLVIDGTLLKSNHFNTVNNLSKKAFIYTWKEQSYEKIYLVKNDMELPFTDAYELRAQHRTGSLCGYAFDFFCKNPMIEANFIIASNNMELIKFGELKQQDNYLSLKYKLKGCNVYVLRNLATMLTISKHPNIKDLLEI